MVRELIIGIRFVVLLFLKYIAIVIGVSLLLFFLLRLAPLDPTAMLVSPTSTPADISRIKHSLGLDLPLWRQYLFWLSHLLHGSLGVSLVSGETISAMIFQALPVTLFLVGNTLVLSILLSLLLALSAYYYRGRYIAYIIDFINNIFICVPDFLWGIALVFIFGITFHLLPFFGLIDADVALSNNVSSNILSIILSFNINALCSLMAHFVLPTVALVMGITPLQVKNLFNQLTQIYRQDYIHYAKLRGFLPLRLLVTQALPNACPSAIALIGNQASMLIGGTLLVETIFGLPGLGMLMIKAINNLDLPLIQGVAFCYTLLVILVQMMTNTLMYCMTARVRGG